MSQTLATDSALSLLLSGLHQRLDALPDAITGDLQRQLVDTERAIARLNALKLKIVAAAHATDISRDVGLADTGAWVARHTRTAAPKAASQVALARSLEALPSAGQALASGAMSTDHAAVIADTVRHLPAGLDTAQRDRVETRLVGLARTVDPATMRRRARRILDDITSAEAAERHHDELLRNQEAAARAKTRLTLHDNGDGTTSGHFTVPTLAGDLLRKVLQQMTAPRRSHLGADSAQGGSPNEQRDWAHRSGVAFVELLEHLPTDRLHSKVAATIVVTMQHRQLLADLGAAGVDTASEISASEARRLACGAGLLPAVLGGQSQVLDLGRTQRLFTEAQRTALAIHHHTCSADGCERPFAWCELHHRQPWSHGGSTDLREAVPLCHWHHQRIHDPAYEHRRLPDGSLRFHRRP